VTISLTVQGNMLTFSVDGVQPQSPIPDPSFSAGVAGIFTGGWYPVRFDSVTVTSNA
jgi:hypothetical protein